MATERLISLDAVIKKLKDELQSCKPVEVFDDYFTEYKKRVIPKLLQDVINYLENQPTVDAVEVVRCKDCEHWNQAKMISPYQCVCEKFTNAPYIYNYRSRNDFCSYGERKNNG